MSLPTLSKVEVLSDKVTIADLESYSTNGTVYGYTIVSHDPMTLNIDMYPKDSSAGIMTNQDTWQIQSITLGDQITYDAERTSASIYEEIDGCGCVTVSDITGYTEDFEISIVVGTPTVNMTIVINVLVNN